VAESTLFAELGGEAVLRPLIDRFVDRVFDDVMIGFLFSRANRQRVKSKEFEFAAAHLGGPFEYSGQPLRDAHGRHPIMGGHFMRRLQILKETLDEFGVPGRVRQHWVEHTLSLQSQITGNRGSECNHATAGLEAPGGEGEEP
jgi:truncated hemoglobin YjbI